MTSPPPPHTQGHASSSGSDAVYAGCRETVENTKSQGITSEDVVDFCYCDAKLVPKHVFEDHAWDIQKASPFKSIMFPKNGK